MEQLFNNLDGFNNNKKSPIAVGLTQNFIYLIIPQIGGIMLAKLTNNIEIPYDELWLNDDDLAI